MTRAPLSVVGEDHQQHDLRGRTIQSVEVEPIGSQREDATGLTGRRQQAMRDRDPVLQTCGHLTLPCEDRVFHQLQICAEGRVTRADEAGESADQGPFILLSDGNRDAGLVKVGTQMHRRGSAGPVRGLGWDLSGFWANSRGRGGPGCRQGEGEVTMGFVGKASIFEE